MRPGHDSPPASSAPSALVALLTEFVEPQGGVWQEVLVRSLVLLRHNEATARQAIARATREGALVATRVGRRAWVELTPDAAATLAAFGRDREPGTISAAADEEWDVYIVRGRALDDSERYLQRTQLILSGLGYLGNGVWIGPSSLNRTVVQQALAADSTAADSTAAVIVLRSHVLFPTVREVIEQVWDLESVRDRYDDLLVTLEASDPTTPDDHLVVWAELSILWLDCMRADPDLPRRALPDGWPREGAERSVAAARESWRPIARDAFARLSADLPPAPVVTPHTSTALRTG